MLYIVQPLGLAIYTAIVHVVILLFHSLGYISKGTEFYMEHLQTVWIDNPHVIGPAAGCTK